METQSVELIIWVSSVVGSFYFKGGCMQFLRRLFGKKKIKYQEPIPYVEKDTRCDLCEHKDECELLEITILADTRQHFISGFSNICKLIEV